MSLLFSTCIPVPFFCAGLLLVFVGLWALRKEFYISQYGLIVPGEVVAVEVRQRRLHKGWVTVYRALVRFQAFEHADPVTFVVSTGSFQVYQVHQQVSVIYVPANPENARVVGRMRWVSPWVVIGFGFLFAATTVIISLPLITIHH